MTRLASSVHATHAARALGAGLARHLATRELDGRVHSVFARAVNVEWNEPAGALLTLHGPAPLAAPFAMALSARLLEMQASRRPTSASPRACRRSSR